MYITLVRIINCARRLWRERSSVISSLVYRC